MFFSALWRSPIRSFAASIPMEKRIMESVIPLFRRSSGVNPKCVVVIGWVTRLSGPPRLGAMMNS